MFYAVFMTLAMSTALTNVSFADSSVAYATGDSCSHSDPNTTPEKQAAELQAIVTPLPDNMYRTSTGAVFEAVSRKGFGNAVKGPDGTIWSKNQGDFSNTGTNEGGIVTDSAATRACAKIGGTLPTKQAFEKLKNSFELDKDGYLTDQGRKDLYAVFPDMKDEWLWTSTVYPESSDKDYYFLGNTGAFPTTVHVSVLSVCCVAR